MNKEILQKAIDTYGEEPQIRQCMEECAELISAIVDYAENDEADIDNITEEMADVLITCKQVEIISKDYVLEPAEGVEGVARLGRKTICNYIFYNTTVTEQQATVKFYTALWSIN